MKYNNKHFRILKDFLDKKIEPEDIAEEDKPIIIELCKARNKQIKSEIEIKNKKIIELKKKLFNN